MEPKSQLLRATLTSSHSRPPQPAPHTVVAAALVDRPKPVTKGGSPAEDDQVGIRIDALVDLARKGDVEAFGQLYDHYLPQVFRFTYARSGGWHLAEDLASETFTRALRSITSFQWQGKDFGAWLTTIARNLVADHFKSSRQRHELFTDELPETRSGGTGTADEVMARMTGERVMSAVRALPAQQRDCLLMRFVQGLSVAQTAETLGRSEGATRQLQLRSVRKLASDLRDEVLR